MSWLGILNFFVLQWFGARLARVYSVQVDFGTMRAVGDSTPIGWRLLRWVWPLTGWWSPYRWIARP